MKNYRLTFALYYGYCCFLNAWRCWPNNVLIDIHLPDEAPESLGHLMADAAVEVYKAYEV